VGGLDHLAKRPFVLVRRTDVNSRSGVHQMLVRQHGFKSRPHARPAHSLATDSLADWQAEQGEEASCLQVRLAANSVRTQAHCGAAQQ
jgi:hypothetical protein